MQNLRDLGVTNPVVAKALSNQDGDGQSPVPVFAALAKNLGVNPQEYLDYFNSLPPDKAAKLEDFIEEYVHGVDPDDKGVYPVEKKNRTYYIRANEFTDPKPNDLTDLANWMRANGYSDAPGL